MKLKRLVAALSIGAALMLAPSGFSDGRQDLGKKVERELKHRSRKWFGFREPLNRSAKIFIFDVVPRQLARVAFYIL